MSFVFIVQCMATHTYTGFLLHCAWWDSHNDDGDDARWDISGVYRGPNATLPPPPSPHISSKMKLQHEADQFSAPPTPQAPLHDTLLKKKNNFWVTDLRLFFFLHKVVWWRSSTSPTPPFFTLKQSCINHSKFSLQKKQNKQILGTKIKIQKFEPFNLNRPQLFSFLLIRRYFNLLRAQRASYSSQTEHSKKNKTKTLD